ncbi:MAG: hypothetical protein K2X97_00915 [Mycobacteriaceae bacterium]|nr:hypothetical protein [Mycobacteriaceae bacterium]
MQYGQMWAQDASAMYRYIADCAAATRLTPFAEPPQTVVARSASRPTSALARRVSVTPHYPVGSPTSTH